MQDFEAEALGILAKASQGYPYFIQELGSAMWKGCQVLFPAQHLRPAVLSGGWSEADRAL